MDTTPSSNHAKITGNFAEHFVLYSLSKAGYECVHADHTGLDILARNPRTSELMGISVKARSRNPHNRTDHLSIPNDNFKKLDAACAAFSCHPYFAIVIDDNQQLIAYLLTMQHLHKIHPPGARVTSWKMTDAYRRQYDDDKVIMKLKLMY